jgi:S-DNA-T family DNA segregation ATPase FtsK/SpoIIIE
MVAALTLMSVFGWAGSLGDQFAKFLGTLFGWERFLTSFVLLFIGAVLLFPEWMSMTTARWVGFGFMIAGSLGILQFFRSTTDALSYAIAGNGGGYIGYIFNQPLRLSLGPWATAIILVAMMTIGALMFFNTTLRRMIAHSSFMQVLQPIRHFFWRRRLAALESERTPQEAAVETDEPHDEQEIAPDHAPELGEGDEGEPDYVPLQPKPKRQKRNIVIPLDLLDLSTSQPTSGNIDLNKERIFKTLETFGIPVEMGEVHVGPTVTQYTLKPADGVKLVQITSLKNDLALALAAHPIRIEAPIPGKSLVGIEVPNESVAMVNLRDILGSDAFKTRKSDLSFSLGKDVAGQPWIANLEPLPHLLVAGSTGSGKSVMINGLIVSLLYSNSPDDLKFIMVDPKRVELSLYNNIPHLLTPVITDTTKTINALRWCVSEMDRRYQVLQNAGKRNISSYRADVSDDMPYIIVVIDELADLMAVAANDVEGMIVRLAQMARAVGIHLVLATQRPSVDVITGLIKANVTARIAFSVASVVDSRTILDGAGAESLLGKGDMLFVSAELSKPKRIQGAYVSEKEVERVTSFLKARGEPEYLSAVTEKASGGASGGGAGMDDLGEDELLPEAKEIVMQSGKASASLLQRRLRVGYARAARLLDLLEDQGFIGPGDGAKPREVYGEQAPVGLADGEQDLGPAPAAEEDDYAPVNTMPGSRPDSYQS